MRKFFLTTMVICFTMVSCSRDGNEEIVPLNSEIPTDANLVNPNQQEKTAIPIPGQYMVTLKDGTFETVNTLKGKINSLSKLAKGDQKAAYKGVSDLVLQTLKDPEIFDFGIDNTKITKAFSFALNGFMAKGLTDQEAALLENDPRVDFVEQDYEATNLIDYTVSTATANTATLTQSTPWGITRVGGAIDASSNTNAVWVIDTGIDLDHQDLNVDTSRSVTYVTTESGANDLGGHGTHCAGTIAAKDNGIGVVGVAAGASVVAVKVLDKDGGASSFGWITSGIDYVTANASAGDVANLSLGFTNVRAWDRATRRLANSGVKVAVAAGNDYDDCSNQSPARVNHSNVYTVSSIADGDYWSRFSNYGSPVDYAAPGSDVLSTTPDDNYEYYSGTSMATPHVAGILLLGNVVADGVPSGAYWEVAYYPELGGYWWTGAYSPTNIYTYSLYRYDVDGNDDPIATHGQ
ncbi:S8 family serine peptidase [Muricauda sp. SCSIO 64092]|uniref:S8 family serine peptidase n=1 Tax=Allomuricauda sp. SCSIO 64092 TaxID=2908842 RepID=UPI001FF2AC8A|nr:S8 family serine peptidase [Muricauda sp. SCSIO 64092]UOY08892.1 S8 family serine peptidase [Muricauda sp. SCSIO 64092]